MSARRSRFFWGRGPRARALTRRLRLLGIMAGAAVFVTTLAVPLEDPALVLALRGNRVTTTG